jgi:histidine phosphotransferase ChpT
MSDNITKLTASNLAALLCARICHDLISPVGAFTTGLDVLDDPDSADMHGDAMNLIRLSSQQANAKLQFLRIAFGSGGSVTGLMGNEQLKTLIFDVYGNGKADLIWEMGDQDLEKQTARLLLNLTMLAVMSVPRGGKIVFAQTQDADASGFTISCTGTKARLEEASVKALAGRAPEAGFDGRTIQPFYAGMIAREIGAKVDARIHEETVVFEVSLPAKTEE